MLRCPKTFNIRCICKIWYVVSNIDGMESLVEIKNSYLWCCFLAWFGRPLEVFRIYIRWFFTSLIDTTTGKTSRSPDIHWWYIWEMLPFCQGTHTWFSSNQIFAFQGKNIVYNFAFCLWVFKRGIAQPREVNDYKMDLGMAQKGCGPFLGY